MEELMIGKGVPVVLEFGLMLTGIFVIAVITGLTISKVSKIRGDIERERRGLRERIDKLEASIDRFEGGHVYLLTKVAILDATIESMRESNERGD